MRTSHHVVLTMALALLGCAHLAAQTVLPATGPTQVQFTASPDHAALLPDGVTPVLDHYDLQLMAGVSGGAVAFTQGLAKPAPDASNTITVPLASGFLAAIVKNAGESVVVVAVGSGGSAASTPFPFVWPGPPRTVSSVKLK